MSYNFEEININGDDLIGEVDGGKIRVKYMKSSGLWVDAPLMQYTGLKDAKGNEIYEDDVIETEQINWADSGEYGGMKVVRGRVVWSGSGFRLHLESGAMPEVNIGTNYHVVKGNIYEHPHLLPKEDERS
jgi:uncharacterized phage protein (TIGR01671 family)